MKSPLAKKENIKTLQITYERRPKPMPLAALAQYEILNKVKEFCIITEDSSEYVWNFATGEVTHYDNHDTIWYWPAPPTAVAAGEGLLTLPNGTLQHYQGDLLIGEWPTRTETVTIVGEVAYNHYHRGVGCNYPDCVPCPGCGGPYDGEDYGGHGCTRACAYPPELFY